MEVIKHAAILRTDSRIIFDRDHALCIKRSPLGTCKAGSIQGFLTNENRFVDRKEAAKIAMLAKQIDKWKEGQILISEELWCEKDNGKHFYDDKLGYVWRCRNL